MYSQIFTFFTILSVVSARPVCKAKNPISASSASTASTSLISLATSTVDAVGPVSSAAPSTTSAVADSNAAVAHVAFAQPSVSSATSTSTDSWTAPSSISSTSHVASSTWSSAAAASSSATSSPPVSGGNTGTATYYAAGLGACGWTNSGSDWIVAMNAPQWSNGGNCGKNVKITNPTTGQTATAQIADLCPGCAWGDLDMSTSLFSYLNNGNMDAGIFQMDWVLA